MRIRSASLVASVFAMVGVVASAQSTSSSGQHWVATWVSAQQPPRAPLGAQAAAPNNGAPRRPAPPSAFNNQTVRMVVHTSIGGRTARIQLSNVHGNDPLTVGAAHIALRAKDSAIVAGSDRALMFNGNPSVSIPAGVAIISDPVDLDVPALGDLAVSVYVPGDTGPATNHNVGLHTTYIVNGDATAQPALADANTSLSWYWLSGVEVLAPANASAIVAFGDSITDGTRSTPNTDSSWPSALARRLAANKATAQLGVLNQGIAANRVLRDDVGTSALGRFDRDVLAQNSVKWMFVLEGINDIRSGLGKTFAFVLKPNGPPKQEVTADELIGAYRQMITRAHEHGIKVIGGTLLPFQGAGNYSEGGNAVRQAVNQWVRKGGAYDWVADFDSVVRDPEHPDHYRAEFDSGDHLHPSDAGYKAMAESIDLSIFGARGTTAALNSRAR